MEVELTMNYAIAIHKDDGSDYGVTVPDLPGCFTAGRTMDEALAMAREAIELHMEGMIEDGESLPDAKPIETHQANPDYADATWAVIQIDPSALPQKAKRINITLPERVLAAADRFADEEGLTRSGLIARSVAMFIHSARQQPDTGRETHGTRSGAKRQKVSSRGGAGSAGRHGGVFKNKASVSGRSVKNKVNKATSPKASKTGAKSK